MPHTPRTRKDIEESLRHLESLGLVSDMESLILEVALDIRDSVEKVVDKSKDWGDVLSDLTNSDK